MWGQACIPNQEQTPQDSTEQWKKSRKQETCQRTWRHETQRKHHTLIPGLPVMSGVARLEKQSQETVDDAFAKRLSWGRSKSFQQILKPRPKPAFGNTTLLKQLSLQGSYFRCAQCDWDHSLALALSLSENKNFDLDYSLVLPGHLKSRCGMCVVLFFQAQELLLVPDIRIYLLYICYCISVLKEHCTQMIEETYGVSFRWCASVNEGRCAGLHSSFRY